MAMQSAMQLDCPWVLQWENRWENLLATQLGLVLVKWSVDQ